MMQGLGRSLAITAITCAASVCSAQTVATSDDCAFIHALTGQDGRQFQDIRIVQQGEASPVVHWKGVPPSDFSPDYCTLDSNGTSASIGCVWQLSEASGNRIQSFSLWKQAFQSCIGQSPDDVVEADTQTPIAISAIQIRQFSVGQTQVQWTYMDRPSGTTPSVIGGSLPARFFQFQSHTTLNTNGRAGH